MESIEKREYYISLYDIYGAFLSDNQRRYFAMYFLEDLSLSEIAAVNDVSRQNVQSSIKNAILKLEKYEKVLHNLEHQKKVVRLKEIIFEKLSENEREEIMTLIDKLGVWYNV